MATAEQKHVPEVVAVVDQLNRMLDAAPRRNPDSDKTTERFGGQDYHLRHTPKIVCADGFTMSVQASAFHYCTPRDSFGPWNSVEIGFPSERVEAFMPYIDGEASDPTDTVYGYVPIELVAQAIVDHGGVAKAEG